MTEIILVLSTAIAGLLLPAAIVVLSGKKILRLWLLILIPTAIVAGICGRTLLAHRNLSHYSTDTNSINGLDTGLADWISRGASIAILVASAIILTGHFLNTRKTQTTPPRHGLIIAFVSFYVGTVISPSFLGAHADFRLNALYAGPTFLAILLSSSNQDIFLRASTCAAIVALVGSLIAAAVIPTVALQPGYNSFIPGINFRLWGLDAHANSLGPLAAVTVLLLLWRPPEKILFARLLVFTAVITLLLTQSKTAILSLLFALAIREFFWRWNRVRISDNKAQATQLFLISSLTLLCFATIAVYAASVSDIGNKILQNATAKEAHALESLTGRDKIWHVTLAEFYKSPIVGYGSKMWGPEFSAPLGLLGVATTGHNQLIDALGMAGVIGGLPTLIYLATLALYAYRARLTSNYYSIAIAAFLLLRSVSEVPFRIQILLSSDVLIHLILLSSIIFSPANRRSSEILDPKNRIVQNQ